MIIIINIIMIIVVMVIPGSAVRRRVVNLGLEEQRARVVCLASSGFVVLVGLVGTTP